MLNQIERQRYDRHLRLSGVGEVGQEKLRNARVLVIGAGGLGCPVLQYLTAAGVGHIGLMDGDTVDISNLQRQVLYDINDLGLPKATVAAGKLKRQNNLIQFTALDAHITVENAIERISEYDLVIDGTDNFPTRYLVGDACVVAGKPLVFGSIFKFEGQVTVFNYKGGPSYRCMFPEPPKANSIPNCADVGVLGILPGIIGSKMAAEALKIILEIGEVLSGSVEITDVLGNRTMTAKVTRNDENFARTALERDYEAICGINEQRDMQLTAKQLKDQLDHGADYQLIDVREDFEFETCSIPGSRHIPLGELRTRYEEISRDKTAVLICHHGIRSAQAIGYLSSKGFTNLLNLSGGIHAWATEVDQEMATY